MIKYDATNIMKPLFTMLVMGNLIFERFLNMPRFHLDIEATTSLPKLYCDLLEC